jgi:hypothetical protein
LLEKTFLKKGYLVNAQNDTGLPDPDMLIDLSTHSAEEDAAWRGGAPKKETTATETTATE